MQYILYPGYSLQVSAPSLVEITALSDVQVLGVTSPTPTTTPTPVSTAAAQVHSAPPATPVVVTVTPPASTPPA